MSLVDVLNYYEAEMQTIENTIIQDFNYMLSCIEFTVYVIGSHPRVSLLLSLYVTGVIYLFCRVLSLVTKGEESEEGGEEESEDEDEEKGVQIEETTVSQVESLPPLDPEYLQYVIKKLKDVQDKNRFLNITTGGTVKYSTIRSDKHYVTTHDFPITYRITGKEEVNQERNSLFIQVQHALRNQ